MTTTPLLDGGIGFGGLLIPAATAAAVVTSPTVLDLPSENDAVYLVEVEAYDGVTVTATLSPDPLPLLAPYPLLAGPLLAGAIIVADQQGVTTLRWSDRGWTSAPGDSVSNVHFPGRASQPLSVQWTMPLAPDDAALMAVAADVTIDNRDGAEDTAARYGIDGRQVVVKRGAPTDAYDDFVTVFTGYGVDLTDEGGDQLHLAVRERGYTLDIPLSTRYGGTGGADGGTEVEGKPKPRLYGLCYNVSGALIDVANLIFQVHDGAVSSIVVYDKGAALTFDADYASYAALAAAVIPSNHYATCLAEGMFRLGSTPSFPVTADVNGDATAGLGDGGGFVSSPALVVRRIMLGRGFVPYADIDHDAIMAAHVLSSGSMGVYFTEDMTVAEAISLVCRGTYLRWGQSRDGSLGVWRIAAPSVPEYAIDASHMLDEPSLSALPSSIGPCLWRVVVNYKRNWTTMGDADIAGAVTTDQRQFLRQAYRSTAVSDTARLTANLQARTLTFDSLYNVEANAAALGSNMLTLFAPGRRMIEVVLPLREHVLTPLLELQLSHPRHNLTGGQNFVVTAVHEDCGERAVTAMLFG